MCVRTRKLWRGGHWSVVLGFLPVGFHFITALKRPMASSSVHGSFRTSSSALLGDCAAGVGVLCCWSVAAGEAA